MPSEPTWPKRWAKPHVVTKIDLAFPARGIDLAPTFDQCRVAEAEWDEQTRRRWTGFGAKLFTSLFFGGPYVHQMWMKPGIDGETAWNHLQVVAGCYGFKHEHKEAALDYLGSRWMDSVEFKEP